MPDEADAPPHPPGRWRSGATFRVFLDDMNEFWQTSEGRRLQGAQQADEADLQAWLADQSGVVVHDHGGYAPEQWKGEVDGHSFYFRERDTEWDIEIDLHPSGHSMRVVDGTHDDGTTRYRQHQIIEATSSPPARSRPKATAPTAGARGVHRHHRPGTSAAQAGCRDR